MNNLGTIKILDNKIIIEKDNKVEVWVKTYKFSNNNIIYKGDYYKLEGDLEDNLDEDEELGNDF